LSSQSAAISHQPSPRAKMNKIIMPF